MSRSAWDFNQTGEKPCIYNASFGISFKIISFASTAGGLRNCTGAAFTSL